MHAPWETVQAILLFFKVHLYMIYWDENNIKTSRNLGLEKSAK